MLKILRNQKGAALPFVLIIFMVLFILGIAFLGTSQSDARQTAWQNNTVQAHYLGRSGVNRGLKMLKDELSKPEPYTGTVQDLIQDLNNQVALTYAIPDAGNYTVTFNEGIYTRQVRITSVGSTTGNLEAQKTVSYMVDLIPPYEFVNPGKNWISGNNLKSGTQPTNVDGSLNTKTSYLGYAVLVQANNVKNAVQSPQQPNGHSTFQASLIALTDSEGESLRQISNSHEITYDAEIIVFPGEVNLPEADKSNSILLTTSDMVLNHKAGNLVSGAPAVPSFLSSSEAVGFENFERYKEFLGTESNDYSHYPELKFAGINGSASPGDEDYTYYGVVRLGGSVYQSTNGNQTEELLNKENEEGYYYFPNGIDITKKIGLNGEYALEDLISIDDDDPLVKILDNITRLTVSNEPGLWNDR